MSNKRNVLFYCLSAFVALIFVAIVFKGLTTAQPGDENAYYYMGRLVNEGKLPYKDFFLAHPPLHVYLISSVYGVFGFSVIALKFIPLLSTLISAFLIFEISRKKFGNAEAILSFVLFLFSYTIMFNSVFSFGIGLATMFLVIGLYFLFIKEKYFVSGIFFGLASITRLLALVPIFVILAVMLLLHKKNFLALSSGFLIVFLPVNGIFALFSGNAYFEQVYEFHLLKSINHGESLREYLDILKLNWVLFLSASLLAFVKEKKHIRLIGLIPVVYLLFLMSLKKIFGFYFIPAFPFLAIMGGYSIIKLFRLLNMRKNLIIALSIVLLLIFGWNLASNVLFLEKIGFTGFERGDDLADFVVSQSNDRTLLFGDDSVAPLLALATGKKIALDFVDTNNQVFISGLKDINKTLASLKGKEVIFVIRSTQGISHFKEARVFLNNDCSFLGSFYDKTEGNYLFYKCS